MDRFVFHGPDRLESQERLAAEGSIVGGDHLDHAGVGLTDERDASASQPDHALGRGQLGADLADEPIAADGSVANLNYLAPLDFPGIPRVDPEVEGGRAD